MRTPESPVGLMREAHPILEFAGTLEIAEVMSRGPVPPVAAPQTESP